MPEVALNPPLVRKVGIKEYIYATIGGPHKMGELLPGDIVVLDARYNENWYHIDVEASQLSDPDLKPPHQVDGSTTPSANGSFAYDDYWVMDRPDGLFLPVDAEVEVPPVVVPDEIAGADVVDALVTLVRFIKSI